MLPSNKTVLITGCNRGIGKAILTKFAVNGFNLIACIRRQNEDFEKFCNDLETKYNITITCYEMDLSESESISATMKAIFKSKVQINVLINNAGIHHISPLSLTSIAQLKDLMQVNFFAQVQITQYVSKWMQKAKKGAIINIGSTGGLDAIPGYTAYGSSKAALMYFSKTISKELGACNIRVNAVAPGLTRTTMIEDISDEQQSLMIKNSALKHLGDTSEVADLVYYLASDEASFITGQIIRVDGGL